MPTHYVRRLPNTSTRGLLKAFQDCQLALTSSKEGLPKPFRNCFAAAWFFTLACLQEQALDAARIKNPVTIVTGFVPRTGIEPALPCDNQILSLARLPVPPSGHFAPKCSAGCNITLSAEFCQNTIEVFFLVVILFYLQHCFLGNRIDLIHFQITLNRCQDFILYGFNLI